MKYLTYKLKDIANWLTSQGTVELPTIQRGFVWKPYQIEILWDSLFRHYPIGSLMLSSTGSKMYLIDGQQRATAISLGFYSPWQGQSQIIGNSKDAPVVWLDLCPNDKPDDCNYSFRVVTKSHPWGYQQKNNANKLAISDRRNASTQYKNLFNNDFYTLLEPKNRFPFDCTLPIPLTFLLSSYEKSGNYMEWWNNILSLCKKHLNNEMTFKHCSKNYILELQEITPYRIEELFKVIQRLMTEYIIPATIFGKEMLEFDYDEHAEDPTLFVRLNSAGTPLNGEELIYSIFKSILPEAKDIVESVGVNFITPSRIVVLISRLILANTKRCYIPKLSVKQFQREIVNDDFRNELKNLIIGKNDLTLKSLINTALNIFKAPLDVINPDKKYNIPNILIKDFILKNQDGFLLLLNWIYNNRDKARFIKDDFNIVILDRLFTTYLFGDLDRLSKSLWEYSHEPNFWKEHTEIVTMNQKPLIDGELIKKLLISKIDNLSNLNISIDEHEIWKQITFSRPKSKNESEEEYISRIKDVWNALLWTILTEKKLLYFAQRKYINSTFQDYNQLANLEDTSAPWDLDHIFPNSWVYGRHDINPLTKYWEDKIGNFRIMSLTDNRSESDNYAPAERFESEQEKSNYFICKSDWEYWSKITKHGRITTNQVEEAKNHAKAIAIRSVNIYTEYLNIIHRMASFKLYSYNQIHVSAKGTIFEGKEWAINLQMCKNYYDCARIFNDENALGKKFTMNVYDYSSINIIQNKDAEVSPDEMWGVACMFSNACLHYYYTVNKDDFDPMVLDDSYGLYDDKPDYPIVLKDKEQRMEFCVKKIYDCLSITGMIFDTGKENLINENWGEPDRYYHGSFDRKGNVIGKISAG